MSGRRPFKELSDRLSPADRAKVEAKKKKLRAEMTLADLREARRLTQESLGAELHVGQTAVAKMEKRTDMYVSNLRRFIEAMGGELEIVARFPDGDVRIKNFEELDVKA